MQFPSAKMLPLQTISLKVWKQERGLWQQEIENEGLDIERGLWQQEIENEGLDIERGLWQQEIKNEGLDIERYRKLYLVSKKLARHADC